MARTKETLSTEEIATIRERTTKAIAPLKPADRTHHYDFGITRTTAGQLLPPYYLVYFLLAELLQFPHGGRWEKVAWSIPVDYERHLAFIEHRKMRLGIFSNASAEDERVAKLIVEAITRGVKAAVPFFD